MHIMKNVRKLVNMDISCQQTCKISRKNKLSLSENTAKSFWGYFLTHTVECVSLSVHSPLNVSFV